MKAPGLTTTINGKNKTLYMQTVQSIKEKTKENLKQTLKGKITRKINFEFLTIPYTLTV